MGEIYALAGGPFNIGSPPQLREVLFERLKLPTRGVQQGQDRTVDRRRRAHPSAPRRIRCRRRSSSTAQLSKLMSTYVDALPALVDPATGRVHTSFNQTVAATGRLSSVRSEPAEHPRCAPRRAVASAPPSSPRPGMRLISADYSQIELRILAHLAEDPGAASTAFASGEDIHARTAAEVFGDAAARPRDGGWRR